jgi:hypothetical protein
VQLIFHYVGFMALGDVADYVERGRVKSNSCPI